MYIKTDSNDLLADVSIEDTLTNLTEDSAANFRKKYLGKLIRTCA